jgi:hypothetical protein
LAYDARKRLRPVLTGDHLVGVGVWIHACLLLIELKLILKEMGLRDKAERWRVHKDIFFLRFCRRMCYND